MISRFFFILAIGLLSNVAIGQSVGLGIKGGLNLADIRGDDDNDVRTNFHFGAFGQIGITDKLFVQGDALVSGQGHDPKTDLDSELKLLYLNVPVVVGLEFAEIVNVHAGPQFGFLLAADAEFQGEEFDVKDGFKSTDLSIVVGGGIEILDKVTAGVRYIHGISNISESDNPGDRMNSVIQVSVGFKLISVGR